MNHFTAFPTFHLFALTGASDLVGTYSFQKTTSDVLPEFPAGLPSEVWQIM
jgi:hypothetical protein